ncbi:LOW QUALITY PROTEIN: hypothetical protein ACHAWF_012568 [Thalassiosira exigua]
MVFSDNLHTDDQTDQSQITPRRTAKYCLTYIINVYTRGGYTISVILMDQDFNKVEELIPQAKFNTRLPGSMSPIMNASIARSRSVHTQYAAASRSPTSRKIL